jgi:universal stress protein E
MVSPESRPVFGLVLVGTDGSDRAAEAVRQAARLASLSGAALQVAYVIDRARPHDGDVEGQAEAVLRRAESIASEEGASARTEVLAGDPATTLLERSRDDGADLICVGPDSGLLGGVIRVGRVAAHVLREASCSVLCARHAGPSFPTKVRCAVDGSDSSVPTAALAARIARLSGAELVIQHVIPIFRGDDREWTLDDEDPTPPALEHPVDTARAAGADPIREMAMGRPEHAIVETARRDGADLIVVGHRGLSGVTRVFLGSVSEYVSTHANCSVLVSRADVVEGAG